MTVPLLKLIERSVAHHPRNIALTDQTESVSYQELWARSTPLPHAPSVEVLQGPRSVALVIDLVRVWRSGGVPLLLDATIPVGRVAELRRMLEEPLPQGLEYLASTSGSSGRPRLVMVPGGGLAAVVTHQIERFGLGSNSVVLWILSPSFDASLSDIGTALAAGATLVCGGERELRAELAEYRITHLDIPPSLLSLYSPGDFPKSLCTLIVGGEASAPELLRAWARHHRVVAVYGPTEATVCSSLSLVDDQWDQPYIGHPNPGVEYRILEGELLIGGPHVARGYLGHSSDNFFEQQGTRWYRTGDLVDQVEGSSHGYRFRGRADRQIKLRGQRIELDEVERRAALVLGRPEVLVELRQGALALFWQAQETGAERARMSESLSQSLPPAWLPTHWVPLANLPRTPSGKPDRRCLRVPAQLPLDSLSCLALTLEWEKRGVCWEANGLFDLSHLMAATPTLESTMPMLRAGRGGRPRSLLVTGLTGRLGQALKPLLEQDFQVWSLQRHEGDERDERVVRGDLREPQLGLDAGQWKLLEQEIDVVLNLAASLELSRSLEQLRAANVDSLSDLSRLGRVVHQASTLAVELSQIQVAGSPPCLLGGYAQSKWLADKALRQVPGYSFRYGQLVGEWADDLLGLVMRGLLDLGNGPTSTGRERLYFDLTPLEWAAQETLQKLKTEPAGRELVRLRRGWQLHLKDLVLGLGLPEVPRGDFFAQNPPTPEAALAQRALGRCDPKGSRFWPDFDLFLLSNDPEPLTRSPEAQEYLQAIITAGLAENGRRRAPVQVPARNETPIHPSF